MLEVSQRKVTDTISVLINLPNDDSPKHNFILDIFFEPYLKDIGPHRYIVLSQHNDNIRVQLNMVNTISIDSNSVFLIYEFYKYYVRITNHSDNNDIKLIHDKLLNLWIGGHMVSLK
jgi:hypothetical protein